MKKRIIVLLVISVVASVAFSLMGCACSSESSGDLTSGQKTVTIELPANASTGYEWTYTMDSKDVLVEESSEYVAPNTDRVGAPGIQKYVFRASKDGRVMITFGYVRTWENEEPDSIATYEVVVKNGVIDSVEGAQNFSEGLNSQVS